MRMTPQAYCKPGDPRKQNVLEASEFYYWSIKYQNLKKISIDDFVDKSIERRCDVCISSYDGSNSARSVECDKKFNKFDDFKKHVLQCENRWRRPLAWTFRFEIPGIETLKREREIGDLRILDKERILKIKFDGLTLIDHITKIRDYINRHGCPCLKSMGLKCQRPSKIKDKHHLFSHLSSIERKSNKYIVFKATSNEIGRQVNSSATPKLIQKYPKKSIINFDNLKHRSTSSASNQKQIEPNRHPSKTHSKPNQTEPKKREQKRTLIIGGKKIEILYKY